jgi:hypothetical protein
MSLRTPHTETLCIYCRNRLQFLGAHTTARVCPSCSTVAGRDGAACYERVKTAFPEDLTLLRPGTTGEYQQKPFEITGRIRMQFRESYQNNWMLLFADGNMAWMSEAYGAFAVYQPSSSKVSSATLRNLKAGDTLKLGKSDYFIESLDSCLSLAMEGEIVLDKNMPQRFISVLLSQPGMPMGVIHIYSKDTTAVYEGTSCIYEQFHFKNTRVLNGWD